MPLNDDVLVLTICHETASDDIPSVLKINDGKYGWHIKLVSADETDIFTLGMKRYF